MTYADTYPTGGGGRDNYDDWAQKRRLAWLKHDQSLQQVSEVKATKAGIAETGVLSPSELRKLIKDMGYYPAIEYARALWDKKKHDEQLALDREKMGHQLSAAERAEKQDKWTTYGTMAGAGVGYYYGGPQGAVVGASVGGMLGGMIGGGCIIITACTSPDSYEVNIARQYRDKILPPRTLAGYYALSEVIVPWIHKSSRFKKIVKRCLVDRMIDYFEVALNYKNKTQFTTSKTTTKAFLGFCDLIGRHVNQKYWIMLHA